MQNLPSKFHHFSFQSFKLEFCHFSPFKFHLFSIKSSLNNLLNVVIIYIKNAVLSFLKIKKKKFIQKLFNFNLLF